MTRLVAASITIISALAAVPHAVHAQISIANNGLLPRANQVYVKIIWPAEPVNGKTNRPVVESWIAKQLEKQGHLKFTAASEWVPLGELSTPVWDGRLDDMTWACSVNGQIAKRSDGRAEVVLDGWGPVRVAVNVSLTDEPGSREIVAVEWAKTDQGLPYVAVLISPVVPEKSVREAGEVQDSRQ